MLYVVFALIGGFLTKVADCYSERKRRSVIISAPLGAIYGTAIGVSGLLNTLLISLIGGLVIGNTLALKVDRLEHFTAVAVILAFAAYSGQMGAVVDPVILVAFAIAAFADEKLHDLGEKASGNKKAILEARLVTPLTALAFVPLSISYFIYIVAFDLGYYIAVRIAQEGTTKRKGL
ncbi:MAG: hypothetical protein N3G76_02130 [Candidatus Micrarchaeota archaeon]|nr:hypothetical protein [Candidatus Micrarchaeota archaeon]